MFDPQGKETLKPESVPEDDMTRFIVRLLLFMLPATHVIQQSRRTAFIEMIVPCVLIALAQSTIYLLIYRWLTHRPLPRTRPAFHLINGAAFLFALLLACGISQGGDAAWKAIFGAPAPGLESKPYDAR